MKTIAHLSDLHFGTEDLRVAEPLVAELQANPPSLVIVSGDLTQRARRGQFAAARAYLDRLPQPLLVVPGNHDVPLFDVIRRFASPLGRYCRQITADLNPSYADDALYVLGLNTARSFTWKAGRISWEQIEWLREKLSAAGNRYKIVVTHHPFIPPPISLGAGIDLVGRAAHALTVLDEFHVDLLLAGHLHHGYAGDTRTHYPKATRSIISVQAGTAISRRVRREPNAYNRITIERGRIAIEVRAWNGREFAAAATSVYVQQQAEWTLASAAGSTGSVTAPPAHS